MANKKVKEEEQSKVLKITLDKEKIALTCSEGLTNIDILSMAVNLFIIVKEKIEEKIPNGQKTSMAKFIEMTCKGLSVTGDESDGK